MAQTPSAPGGKGANRRRPSAISMSTRRNRARSPSLEPSDTSSMSSVELTPPPDTPTTPAIVKRAAQARMEAGLAGAGAGRRLQDALAGVQVEQEGEGAADGEMDQVLSEEVAQGGSGTRNDNQGTAVDTSDVHPISPTLPSAIIPKPATPKPVGGKAQPPQRSKGIIERISRTTMDESSAEDTDSSEDETEETPLFDDAVSGTSKPHGKAHLKISINPKQALHVDLPEPKPEGTSEPVEVYTYPPSCVPLKYLSEATQQIKLARFLRCRTDGCQCDGLKPPGYSRTADHKDASNVGSDQTSRIVLWIDPTTNNVAETGDGIDIQGLETSDTSAREITHERLWERCGACGCGWRTGGVNVGDDTAEGGHTLALIPENVDMAENANSNKEVDKDELQRRRRVAHRAEEMLEDVGKLLDFGYMNEEIAGTLKQLEPFQAPHASKTVPTIATTGLKGLPKTGKSLKRSLDDREHSESIPDSAPLETFPTTGDEGASEKANGEEEDDDEEEDDEDEAASKRLRLSKTGKRGPAGRVPLKTKADEAGAGNRASKGVAGGQGAGKQAASKSREPVSIVRKIDGDAIVDEQGNVLDKRENDVEEVEVDGDETMDAGMDVDRERETPVPDTFRTEEDSTRDQLQESEDKVVDRLTNGVTIDMDGTDKLPESLDDVDDWGDVEFEQLPPKPARVECEKGYIKLPVVSSSEPSAASSIVLIGLKNLFQRQLPKMPREYITRLVLDDKHYSMAIVKRGWRVVGGICYRPFESRNFAEIVFCAVESTEQIRGYGSFLMNQVKDYVRQAHPTITHFLTYADNYAIGYFKKQGFSKEITFPRERWVGYIKDYDSANLMMCKMIPRVKYTEVHQMLADQKAAVLAKIQTISQSHVVRPGIDIFKNRTPGETIKLAKEDIPGLVESGWDAQMDELLRTSIRPPQYVLFQQILNDLVDDANAWPFVKPVDRTVVKDYYDVIAVPMDLQTMELKLESNHYKDLEEFTRDVKLIVANCKQYNGHSNDNSYTKAANALEKAFNKILVKRTAQATGTVIDKKDKKDKK